MLIGVGIFFSVINSLNVDLFNDDVACEKHYNDIKVRGDVSQDVVTPCGGTRLMGYRFNSHPASVLCDRQVTFFSHIFLFLYISKQG